MVEIPHIFLYRAVARTLTVTLPAELPYGSGEAAAGARSARQDLAPTIIAIWGRFRYDGVYVVLEQLEVWPATFYLRYHVTTPAGRLIKGDYALAAGLADDPLAEARRRPAPWYENHLPPDLGQARGVMVRHRQPNPGPVQLVIHAVGEHHGALRWCVPLTER